MGGPGQWDCRGGGSCHCMCCLCHSNCPCSQNIDLPLVRSVYCGKTADRIETPFVESAVQNGWTGRAAIWDDEWDGPKESCIIWSCTRAPPGKYGWTTVGYVVVMKGSTNMGGFYTIWRREKLTVAIRCPVSCSSATPHMALCRGSSKGRPLGHASIPSQMPQNEILVSIAGHLWWNFFKVSDYMLSLCQQVYLLTPMDRAMLLHVKSTMGTAKQVQLPGNERRSIAHCYADR